MKKQITVTALILTAVMTCAAAGSIGKTAKAAAGSTGNAANEAGQSDLFTPRERELAKQYPLEAVRQHAIEASQNMDIPEDRLYAIVTYGGEDHLMIAEEHKEEDHYGAEYIHTMIDTDGVDGYEPEPVNMYFECPVCKSYSSAIIRVDDDSHGRVFWCKCEEPWVIGLAIKEELVK